MIGKTHLSAFALLILASIWASACSPVTPTAALEVVPIYSTAAAEPWLAALYDCAPQQIVLSRVDDPTSAQIALRVGEPDVLPFAYQIDTEEVLIVTHRQSPIQNLTLDEARALFAGRGDPSVQTWVYASDTDVQQVFDRSVMEGSVVTSTAQLAVHPQQMSDTLVNEPNTVGILPAHWKAGDTRVVYTLPNVPVLAITQEEPQGPVRELIACLQK